MNRFGDGGLIERPQLFPELTNAVTQETAFQRSDDFTFSRSFDGDIREQG
jgi:hypothetical protein